MIFHIDKDNAIDTDRDLSPAERHVVQKLLGWKLFVKSVEELRLKKQEALQQGWGDSGPLRESRPLTRISDHLEKELLSRLKEKKDCQEVTQE